MKLKRKYSNIDILLIPFKLAKMTTGLEILVAILQAIFSTSLIAITTAFFVDTVTDVLTNKKEISNIYLPLVSLILVLGINSNLDNVLNLLAAKIKYVLNKNMLPAIVKRQGELSYKYIEDKDSLELIKRVSDEMIETFLDSIKAYRTIIQCIVVISSIAILLITKVFWATIVIVIFSVLLFFIAVWAGNKNYKAKVETKKYERRYSYYSDDILTSREAVEERTLFGYSNEVIEKYYNYFEISAKIQLRVLLKTKAIIKGTSIALILIAIATMFFLIPSLIDGRLSAGMFIGIVMALFSVVETLGNDLQEAVKNLAESKEYMKDLTKLMNFETVANITEITNVEKFSFDSLEFKNVSFKYSSANKYILKKLSFKIEAGKSYAFVGENGAGKTTITKLLTKLYEDYEGEILINGKNLKEYDATLLKSIVSVIYQDYARYQVSLRDNISLGNVNKEIDDDEMNSLITKMELGNLVSKLPKGLDTKLGKLDEFSVDVSGGEWQKIATARSLISPAPIKILDEPTAALDPISENNIYMNFQKLLKDRTTILISHRLGSTKLADEIFVLDGGTIKENGTYGELMAKKGLYYEMFETQRKWYE